MIHEAFHSVSQGFSPGHSDARSFGWEEGTVEQLQRLFRSRLLKRLGLSVPEESFRPEDLVHPFNSFIRELESVRAALRQEPEAFYLAMLRATPLERVRIKVAATRVRGVQQSEGSS